MDKIERLISQARARVVRQHVPEDFASLQRFRYRDYRSASAPDHDEIL